MDINCYPPKKRIRLYSLSTYPNEIWESILVFISDVKTKSALCLTCKQLNDLIQYSCYTKIKQLLAILPRGIDYKYTSTDCVVISNSILDHTAEHFDSWDIRKAYYNQPIEIYSP